MRYGMIMAGGAGTRLWPMSRPGRPKQLLPLIGGRSLLDLAADRLEGVVPPARRYLCIDEALRGIVRRQVPQFSDAQILGEPAGRDTLNAVGFTAAVLVREDPDAIFTVLTSDHIIEPQDAFRASLEVGFTLVESDPSRFVTFSVRPTEPSTAFGYVERGAPVEGMAEAWHVKRFVEKPDAPTARSFLDAGTFEWNAGMFVFHAATFLETLARYRPKNHALLDRIGAAWNGPERDQTLGACYPELEKVSVDYGMMEPASEDPAIDICTVPMAVEWADLGSWPSYADTLDADADGHRTNAASALHLGSRNITVVTEDPDELVTTIGCEDLIVIRSGRRTLICRPADAQRVREMAEQAAKLEAARTRGVSDSDGSDSGGSEFGGPGTPTMHRGIGLDR
ncbi:MAG: mannose-1-phosphate guanylyltransferase [Phycisphaerales bacterium]